MKNTPRRKRSLTVNSYEKSVDDNLRDVAARNRARVCPKVNMLDALDERTERPGVLTYDERSYAMKAHFDFVIDHKDDGVMFAVEYDGPQHSTDADTIRRDNLKNAICEKLEFPLLRIDADCLLKIDNYYTSLLSWLVEMFFLEREFSAAQERGEIPDDEPWHYGNYLGVGFQDGDEFVTMRIADCKSLEEFYTYLPKLLATNPYDPFMPARRKLKQLYESGKIKSYTPEMLWPKEENGYISLYALVELASGRTVVGKSRCRTTHFVPISNLELAEELAIVDVVAKIEKVTERKSGVKTAIIKPSTTEQIQELRLKCKRFYASLVVPGAVYGDW